MTFQRFRSDPSELGLCRISARGKICALRGLLHGGVDKALDGNDSDEGPEQVSEGKCFTVAASSRHLELPDLQLEVMIRGLKLTLGTRQTKWCHHPECQSAGISAEYPERNFENRLPRQRRARSGKPCEPHRLAHGVSSNRGT